MLQCWSGFLHESRNILSRLAILAAVLSVSGLASCFTEDVHGLQALIDGPYTLTGVSRQTINFKRVALTDYKVKIGVNAGHKALTTAWTKGDIKAKWAASAWGQRLAKRVAKAETSDFDRFAAMITKQNVRECHTCLAVLVVL
jgi:ribosomal protein L14E/L6E/L27E